MHLDASHRDLKPVILGIPQCIWSSLIIHAINKEGTLQIALLEGNFFHDAGVTSMDKAAKAKQLLGLPSGKHPTKFCAI